MLKDKYYMSTEENVLYAKRNIVDSIWKSANLEGILVTFSEAQAIYDGANVGHLRIDEIQAINNLKHAWQFVIYSINTSIDLKFIQSIHAFEKMNSLIEEYQNSLSTNATDTILTFMCKLMKMQAFNDGNKRTSMLVANHELIKNGKGILSIADEDRIEFGTRLIKYYENEESIEELKQFLYKKCLDGVNSNT